MIRTILVILIFALFLIGCIPLLIIEYIVGLADKDKQEWQTLKIMQFVMKAIVFVSGTQITVHGLENLPVSKDEAVLFVGNHRSMLDIPCEYIFMKAPTGFFAKIETMKVPFMHFWMEKMGCLFFDRKDVKQNLREMMRGMENVKNGTSLLIYPEGTRLKAPDKDKPATFKEGSLKIAQKTGCRMIPVAIKNTENIYEMHRPFIRRAKVELWFMEPLYYNDIQKISDKTPGEYIRSIIEERLKGENYA